MKTLLIVNPNAGQGNGAKVLPQIEAALNALGIPFDKKLTTGPNQAIAMARQAVLDGYERVVAVGGDGTSNEVVNGLFTAPIDGPVPCLGLLPVGSGNDFAHVLGIPTDVEAACRMLKDGQARRIDLGLVTVDGVPRYFDNSTGIGFDGDVVVDLSKGRRLQGFFMYLWSVFRVLFSGHWPYTMRVTYNDIDLHQPITLITIANGTRAGGGFLLTPLAHVDDGLLDLCYAGALSRWGVLNLLPKTLNGSHIHDPAITMDTAPGVRIVIEGGAPAHIDGEVLCTNGREFEFTIFPKKLCVWAGQEM